jgi:hypothetical protein
VNVNVDIWSHLLIGNVLLASWGSYLLSVNVRSTVAWIWEVGTGRWICGWLDHIHVVGVWVNPAFIHSSLGDVRFGISLSE